VPGPSHHRWWPETCRPRREHRGPATMLLTNTAPRDGTYSARSPPAPRKPKPGGLLGASRNLQVDVRFRLAGSGREWSFCRAAHLREVGTRARVKHRFEDPIIQSLIFAHEPERAPGGGPRPLRAEPSAPADHHQSRPSIRIQIGLKDTRALFLVWADAAHAGGARTEESRPSAHQPIWPGSSRTRR